MDFETALSLVTEDHDEKEYTLITDWVDDGHSKHDYTDYYIIALSKVDNTFWRINFTSSYSYGVSEDYLFWYKVKKKAVTQEVWVQVGDGRGV